MKRRTEDLYAAILLGLFALISFGSASRESLTYDEAVHLTSGFIFWKTGRYLDLLHPPLLRLWAALPLLFFRLGWPALNDFPPRYVWIYSYAFMHHNRLPVDLLVLPARAMIILLGVGLGYLIWRWSREVFGKVAALAGLIAYCFSPPMLAYSHYVTTDFGAMAFSTLALYLAWRWRNEWSHVYSLALGASVGLAFASKFTEGLIIPILGFLRSKNWIEQRKWRLGLPWNSVQGLLLCAGFTAALILTYRVSQIHYLGDGLRVARDIQMGDRIPHFYHGQYSDHGWTWFMSVVFLIKTPLPFLVLILGGWVLFVRRRYPVPQFALFLLWLPCLVYVGFVSMAQYQIGLRRVLWLYPLMSIWIGGTVSVLWSSGSRGRWVSSILGIWYVTASLLAFPDYLPYFNESIGGSSSGYRYLADCNVDWGQGLKALGVYLQKRNIHGIALSYFGTTDPHAYGFRYLPIASVTGVSLPGDGNGTFTDEKAFLFAVSATNRAGLYYRDHHLFDWLNAYSPVAQIAQSIFVYDFTHDLEARKQLERVRLTPPFWEN